jgi:hypothetical protein
VQNFTLYEVPSVRFPSGSTVSFGERDFGGQHVPQLPSGARVHGQRQPPHRRRAGRRSHEGPALLNIHYFAAGATLFGTEVKGAYEFAGREYTGRNEHVHVL